MRRFAPAGLPRDLLWSVTRTALAIKRLRHDQEPVAVCGRRWQGGFSLKGFHRLYPQLRPVMHWFWPPEQVSRGFFDQPAVPTGIGCYVPSARAFDLAL